MNRQRSGVANLNVEGKMVLFPSMNTMKVEKPN